MAQARHADRARVWGEVKMNVGRRDGVTSGMATTLLTRLSLFGQRI